jgi:hypothetical protein
MRRKSLVAALAALCFAFGLSPLAFAADIINGCVQPNGTLRIVDSASACRVGEAPLLLTSPAAVPRVIHGTVNGNDGAIINGTGFTVTGHPTNVDDGHYTINFTTPFTSTPNCFFHTSTDFTAVYEVRTLSVDSQHVSIITGFVVVQPNVSNVAIVNAAVGSFEFVCVQ